jgi:hypothetical protein
MMRQDGLINTFGSTVKTIGHDCGNQQFYKLLNKFDYFARTLAQHDREGEGMPIAQPCTSPNECNWRGGSGLNSCNCSKAVTGMRQRSAARNL